jgi:putative oxidoreductase
MNLANVTLLVLRLVVGFTFAAHGAQKAFGWWNGPGPERWRNAIAGMGLHPVRFWAALSIGVELVGGLLLAIGLVTPLAATMLIGQATMIILKAHLPKGFFTSTGGIEFPLALGAGTIALLGIGPGTLSVDQLTGFGLVEPVLWLLLVIGLAGGLGAYTLTRLAPAREPTPQPR